MLLFDENKFKPLNFIEKFDYMVARGIYSEFYIFKEKSKYGVGIDKDYTENYIYESYKDAVKYANDINNDDIEIIKNNISYLTSL